MNYQTLTPQQVFDNALFGLRKQRVGSSSGLGSTCAYRNEKGHACGIGFSIPDDLAQRMDNATVSGICTLLDHHRYPELKKLFGRVSDLLLHQIQLAHDTFMPRRLFDDERDAEALARWDSQMKNIAEMHDLVYTEPEAE